MANNKVVPSEKFIKDMGGIVHHNTAGNGIPDPTKATKPTPPPSAKEIEKRHRQSVKPKGRSYRPAK